MSTEAPFRQIVGQIRAQIDGGQLRPGDRVPSARQITAEWGVAIATATKVLAALRAEGLVEAVRGVGTIVADRDEPAEPVRRERRQRPAAAEPTREQMVRHALALADAEGLEAVSMRRLATEFGLATMSLYRFVRGKDDLVRLMIDAAFAEAPLPAVPPKGVQAQLTVASRQLWGIFRRHPWLAPAMSITRPEFAPHGMKYTEWSLAALDSLGLSETEMMQIHLSIFAFVRGLAMGFATEAQAAQHTGMSSDEWMERQAATFDDLIGSGRFPMVARISAIPDFELGLDAVFDYGLPRFLHGILPN
ncbi:TetR/AcrR family transcriptional regulator C-terminal domain-containing protein [Catellatospora vulcania]|uniref:TetR/AcrR family transcriptional regulator C-terminal domain-containing protein n=1 Tax=Catellatospora vulcania TaxID=1460450 RepID=UPI001E291B10|nr:TetR/AcrR family transcriptional regulator C-terminal domain-containing protein [Catellatospora vulcania]